MHPIRAGAEYAEAIDAVADLLGRLKLDCAFVGSVARSAWLGGIADARSLDVLAVMGPQQKTQLATMAANRGFRVERDELEQAEELDLVPMRFGDLRVHVLIGSNALYGRMVAAAAPAEFRDRAVKVPAAEDFALLLAMSEDDDGVRAMAALPSFDRERYNRSVASIGLGERILR